MVGFVWKTDFSLVDDSEIMQEYLTHYNMLDIVRLRAGVAIGENYEGDLYAIYASSNGGDCSHKIEFELVKGDVNDYF